MADRTVTLGNLRVGRRGAKPTLPTHVRGVRKGNEPGGYERQGGHLPDGRSTARRSTGVAPDSKNPIDPRMPNLSPP